MGWGENGSMGRDGNPRPYSCVRTVYLLITDPSPSFAPRFLQMIPIPSDMAHTFQSVSFEYHAVNISSNPSHDNNI
jgi:hypothetical protein